MAPQQHVHVHGACLCPCCMPMSRLHANDYASCPCPCGMPMPILHAHVHVACSCPCSCCSPCPCCMSTDCSPLDYFLLADFCKVDINRAPHNTRLADGQDHRGDGQPPKGHHGQGLQAILVPNRGHGGCWW